MVVVVMAAVVGGGGGYPVRHTGASRWKASTPSWASSCCTLYLVLWDLVLWDLALSFGGGVATGVGVEASGWELGCQWWKPMGGIGM